MIKRLQLIFFALLAFAFAEAQQIGAFSQYLQNPYILNQAYAGVENGMEGGLSYRRQWTNIQGGPINSFVSFHGAVAKPRKRVYSRNTLRTSGYPATQKESKVHHGFGGILFYDRVGVFNQFNLKGSYAVHVKLTPKYTISVGPSIGLSREQIRTSEIEFIDPNDPTYNDYIANGNGKTFLDANFGAWFYSDELFVGYSINQLGKTRIGKDGEGNNEQAIHHFITTGYKFRATRELFITPSVLVRAVENTPVTIDINGRIDYLDIAWAGLSFRPENSLTIMGGVHVSDLLKVGYSYDVYLNEIQRYGSGSHEFYVGLTLYQND